MARERTSPLELEHAGERQYPAHLAGLEQITDMPLAAAGFGVAVTRLLDRSAKHQAAFLHMELILGLIALGHVTAQLLQIDRREMAAAAHGTGNQFAVVAAAGPLYGQIDLVQAVAGEINSVHIFLLTSWEVLATKKSLD
jgi:hypothetical protein